MLSLAILVGLLAALGALPALADGEIPMYVHQSRVAYTGRSSGGPDDIVGYVHIRDDNLARVVGAIVTVDWSWTLAGGAEGELLGATATTGDQGLAVFDGLYEEYGEYTICVTDVTMDGGGWVYDPGMNWEGQTCATLVVAPRYAPGR
jgi:hypothetical protein